MVYQPSVSELEHVHIPEQNIASRSGFFAWSVSSRRISCSVNLVSGCVIKGPSSFYNIKLSFATAEAQRGNITARS